MPEERGLYPKMRVSDQLVHFARLHGVDAAGARAAAERWLDRLGLAEVADRRTETLSLGNQQRAQLAAALVHDPELLVLDEPFSGLDPVGVDVLSEVLRERARGGRAGRLLEPPARARRAPLRRGRRSSATGGSSPPGGSPSCAPQRGARRWRVEVDGRARRTGSPRVPSVVVAHTDADAVVVELAEDADEQALLDAARRAGRVRRFAPVEPTLADLFREVVGVIGAPRRSGSSPAARSSSASASARCGSRPAITVARARRRARPAQRARLRRGDEAAPSQSSGPGRRRRRPRRPSRSSRPST